jgi:hypothetical protein
VREVYFYDARNAYAGDTKFDISRSETKDSADRKACVVGLSGIAAALKHDPDRDPRAAGDKERVDRLLRAFPTSSRPALYHEFEIKARELVALLWPCVCVFANAIEAQSPDSNGLRSLQLPKRPPQGLVEDFRNRPGKSDRQISELRSELRSEKRCPPPQFFPTQFFLAWSYCSCSRYMLCSRKREHS